VNPQSPAQRSSVQRSVVTALFLSSFLCCAATALAFDRYSINGGDATNCGSCHGNFRSSSYISNTDGTNWGNLHNLHRSTMLGGDCDTCHGNNDLPVRMNLSSGGSGLSPIGCVGCHGRNEDNVPANPEVAAGHTGYGAALRQHHFVAGVEACNLCHLDADPDNYTTVGEDVMPDYYAHPGIGHPAIPDDPCNADGSEDFAGSPEGLDNDGNDVYDMSDAGCGVTGILVADVPSAASLIIGSIAPNPLLTGGTDLRFSIATAADVNVRLFDVAGRQLREQSLGPLAAGWHTVRVEVSDASGVPLSNGIYLLRIEAGAASTSGRVVLIR